MPKQIPKIGDVFLIPLNNRKCAVGQIVEIEVGMMSSITCVFYNGIYIPEVEIGDVSNDISRAISCQFVTRDLFNNGTWKRISNRALPNTQDILPYRETKSNGWIGAKMIGSGIIKTFLNAYNGLDDWRGMHDKQYFEKLLLPGVFGPRA